FAVLRGETYAAHTLASVAFPGASGAVYLGLAPLVGYFGFAVAGAGLIVWLSPGGSGHRERHSATVGAVQAMALALGFWFVSLYRGFLTSLSGFLFGSFLGVTHDDVIVLAVTAVLAVGLLAILGRPRPTSPTDPWASGSPRSDSPAMCWPGEWPPCGAGRAGGWWWDDAGAGHVGGAAVPGLLPAGVRRRDGGGHRRRSHRGLSGA